MGDVDLAEVAALGEGAVRIPTLADGARRRSPLPLMVDFTRREVVAGGAAGGAGGRRAGRAACSSRATWRPCSNCGPRRPRHASGSPGWTDRNHRWRSSASWRPSTGTPCSGCITPEGVAAVHEPGRRVSTWTVDTPEDMTRRPRGRRRRRGEQPHRRAGGPPRAMTTGADRCAASIRTARRGVSDAAHLGEEAVDPAVRRELGVERRRQHRPLAHQDRHAVEGGQDVDRVPDRDHQRGPDEDGRQGRPLAGPEHDVGFEGLLLAPVAVAADDGVEDAEGALVRAPVEDLPRRPGRARRRSRGSAGAARRRRAGRPPRRTGRWTRAAWTGSSTRRPAAPGRPALRDRPAA